jgi:hypothetical protein
LNGDVIEIDQGIMRMYSIKLDFKTDSRLLVVRGQDSGTGKCTLALFELKADMPQLIEREVFSEFGYCEGDVSDALGCFNTNSSD